MLPLLARTTLMPTFEHLAKPQQPPLEGSYVISYKANLPPDSG